MSSVLALPHQLPHPLSCVGGALCTPLVSAQPRVLPATSLGGFPGADQLVFELMTRGLFPIPTPTRTVGAPGCGCVQEGGEALADPRFTHQLLTDVSSSAQRGPPAFNFSGRNVSDTASLCRSDLCRRQLLQIPVQPQRGVHPRRLRPVSRDDRRQAVSPQPQCSPRPRQVLRAPWAPGTSWVTGWRDRPGPGSGSHTQLSLLLSKASRFQTLMRLSSSHPAAG